MNGLTEVYVIRVSKQQKETLKKLKDKYNIHPNLFIRQAIKEKINRDYKELREKIKIKDCPF